MGEPAIAAEFLYHLRIAVLGISGIVLLSMSWLRSVGAYRPLWMQLVAYGLLLGIAVVEGVLTLRRRSWGGARWAGVALALAASVLSCLSLPTGTPTTAADWAFGSVGWIGVVLLLDRPMVQLVLFLGAHWAITAVNLVLSGPVDEGAVLNFVSGSLGTIGFPLACGVAATALRATAGDAEAARRQTEDIRHSERVAARTAQALQDSYAGLAGSAGPLLRGLADGSLDSNDPDVRRDCWIEAARMRRLFVETDDVPNQLVHELRQYVDTAERRRVRAEMSSYGTAVDPPPEVRLALGNFPLPVLAGARSWARVTVVFTSEFVSVQVIGDCGAIDLPRPGDTAATGAAAGIEIGSFLDADDDTLLMEAKWRRTGRSPS
ncbi:hypothetical protein OHS33_37460 (plasmid) [Streptomyces sp. NBC_00536]|uniref:hypothetical protein n=1 Tax=Streptomyces sp. NBC_00536 TaxID=2975769 RepID=UPI002E80B396|nr:hypothetical protein [Streptomyces sp. NBC_00536]WUC84097.1 hypothetical protein OHS33_37460 [Streptomyces sp. NBC_00536]